MNEIYYWIHLILTLLSSSGWNETWYSQRPWAFADNLSRIELVESSRGTPDEPFFTTGSQTRSGRERLPSMPFGTSLVGDTVVEGSVGGWAASSSTVSPSRSTSGAVSKVDVDDVSTYVQWSYCKSVQVLILKNTRTYLLQDAGHSDHSSNTGSNTLLLLLWE